MRLWFDSWVRKIHWRRDRLLTPVCLGFPGGSFGKESAYNAGDLGSIPWLGRSPGEGNGNPLQSWTEEPGGLHTVHGVTQLDTTERLHFAFIMGIIYQEGKKKNAVYKIAIAP